MDVGSDKRRVGMLRTVRRCACERVWRCLEVYEKGDDHGIPFPFRKQTSTEGVMFVAHTLGDDLTAARIQNRMS